MHAYLLISQNSKNIESQIGKLADKLSAKILEFPIVKIEDTRNLNSLTRLSFSEPTLIVSKNIHEATEEALNAFLKNLEEPGENIYFALTTTSVRKVVQTIVSRCEIIKITDFKKGIENDDVNKFFEMSPSQRLSFFDKIRDRIKATQFIEGLIFCLHEKGEIKNMEILSETLKRLKGNGNINLQLTNLLVNYA